MSTRSSDSKTLDIGVGTGSRTISYKVWDPKFPSVVLFCSTEGLMYIHISGISCPSSTCMPCNLVFFYLWVSYKLSRAFGLKFRSPRVLPLLNKLIHLQWARFLVPQCRFINDSPSSTPPETLTRAGYDWGSKTKWLWGAKANPTRSHAVGPKEWVRNQITIKQHHIQEMHPACYIAYDYN